MYPRNYFDFFPPFPRNLRVFVAMSFDDRFKKRWEFDSLMILGECQNGQITHPQIRTMGDALGQRSRVDAIRRLLEMGAIKTVLPKFTPQTLQEKQGTPAEGLAEYHATRFGDALFKEVTLRFGFGSPDMQEQLMKVEDSQKQ